MSKFLKVLKIRKGQNLQFQAAWVHFYNLQQLGECLGMELHKL